MATIQKGPNGQYIFNDHAEVMSVTSTATAVVSGASRFLGLYVSNIGAGTDATVSVYDGSSSDGQRIISNVGLTAGASHIMPAPVLCRTGIFVDPDGTSLTGVHMTVLYLKDDR